MLLKLINVTGNSTVLPNATELKSKPEEAIKKEVAHFPLLMISN